MPPRKRPSGPVEGGAKADDSPVSLLSVNLLERHWVEQKKQPAKTRTRIAKPKEPARERNDETPVTNDVSAAENAQNSSKRGDVDITVPP
jgi:hypothetical protein